MASGSECNKGLGHASSSVRTDVNDTDDATDMNNDDRNESGDFVGDWSQLANHRTVLTLDRQLRDIRSLQCRSRSLICKH
jgi:hypothetical protein